MTFYPAVAYGIAFAVVALLTVCGIQNRRAGYRRERYDLIGENLDLWQSFQQPQEMKTAQASTQSLKPSVPAPVLQDQMAYHALQLSQLQNALAAAGTPSIRPEPTAAPEPVPQAAGKKGEIRIA